VDPDGHFAGDYDDERGRSVVQDCTLNAAGKMSCTPAVTAKRPPKTSATQPVGKGIGAAGNWAGVKYNCWRDGPLACANDFVGAMGDGALNLPGDTIRSVQHSIDVAAAELGCYQSKGISTDCFGIGLDYGFEQNPLAQQVSSLENLQAAANGDVKPLGRQTGSVLAATALGYVGIRAGGWLGGKLPGGAPAVVTTEDLYNLNNAQGPALRADPAVGGLPAGVSTWNSIEAAVENGLHGIPWRLPEGTSLPKGYGLTNDDPILTGHRTITTPKGASPADVQSQLSPPRLPWEKAGRRIK
jgi:hypothetical protein